MLNRRGGGNSSGGSRISVQPNGPATASSPQTTQQSTTAQSVIVPVTTIITSAGSRNKPIQSPQSDRVGVHSVLQQNSQIPLNHSPAVVTIAPSGRGYSPAGTASILPHQVATGSTDHTTNTGSRSLKSSATSIGTTKVGVSTLSSPNNSTKATASGTASKSPATTQNFTFVSTANNAATNKVW